MSKADDYIRLTYFNARGRCEHIRLCFAAANIVYEDKRISFDDWPMLKSRTPTGTLPMLEINGQKVGQSLAAGRLAAKISKLYGSTTMDQARVDMIADTANDFREGFITIATMKDERAKAEELPKYLKEKAAPIFTKLNEMLPNGVSDDKLYFVGNKLSWADIHFYAVTEIGILTAGISNLLDEWPRLKIIRNNVETRCQGIAKYLKTRPKTEF